VDKTDDPTAFSCRYETISFSPGLTTMDGKTALKFVRSRHGTNNEGSDFARADRQQRVISAFKSEVLSAGTILNPSRVTSLIEEFGNSVEMDITLGDYGEFMKLAQLTQDAEIRTHTISAEGEEALLAVPPSREPYGGAYVLVSKTGSWSDVHAKVREWLADPQASPTSSESPSPSDL
jgi:anionic cell wall polymer biosynthesis LytR-Cps2A-Psr (LCP) family protein